MYLSSYSNHLTGVSKRIAELYRHSGGYMVLFITGGTCRDKIESAFYPTLCTAKDAIKYFI